MELPIYLVAIITIVFMFTVAYALMLCAISLAKKDKFFTLVPQNQYRALMRSASVPKKIFGNIRGKYVNPKTYQVEDITLLKSLSFNNFLIKNFGMAWIGLAGVNSIFKYRFRWNKLVTEESLKLVPKDEWITWLYHAADYAIEIRNIDLKGNLKAKFIFKVRTETTNPFTTLFDFTPHGDWLNRLSSSFFGTIKEYGSQKEFNEVRDERVEYTTVGTESTLTKMITAITGDGSKYGQKIIDFDFLAFDLEQDEEAEKILKSKALAKLKGEADIEKAEQDKKVALINANKDFEVAKIEAEAKYVEKTRDAEAEEIRMEKVYNKAAEKKGGKEMFIAEQVRNSNLQALGGNTLLNLTPNPHKENEEG
ncbi:MAG: hypothetical protein WC795_01760 [Candidatus Paceibacterota bacterium]|jgi:hypothetical protein